MEFKKFWKELGDETTYLPEYYRIEKAIGEWAWVEIVAFMVGMSYREWDDFDGEEMCEYGTLKDIAIICLGIKEIEKRFRIIKEGDK